MPSTPFSNLLSQNLAYVVELRREFHMYPELSLQEHRTSARIAEELSKMGIPCAVVGNRNIIGTLAGARPGRRLALRADFDALPMQEALDLPFKSKVDGVMHACGHDAHAAMLLGAAKTLAALQSELAGTLYFCFQVAEEIGGGGAQDCVAYLQQHGRVDGVAALHVDGAYPVGTIDILDGVCMSGSNEFTVTVQGRGGHGARPDRAIDPIRPACDILLQLQAIPANRNSLFDPVVVSPCVFHAGTKANIIPDTATIEGTLRYYKTGSDDAVMADMQRIAEKTAESYGATAHFERRIITPCPVINNAGAAAAGRALAAELGYTTLPPHNPGAASDDYAVFLSAFPGFYGFLGCHSDLPGTSGNMHNTCFCLNEDALPVGMAFLANYAWRFLQGKI